MMQKMKESYAFFSSSGNGSWELDDESLRMKGWKNVSIKRTHVLSLDKLGNLALNKVALEMKYFDMFGGTEKLEFAMREADFRALKQSLGK